MRKFFLVIKLFVMRKFFLVTILILPFSTISLTILAMNMAHENNNEMNKDEIDLIKSLFFQGLECKDISQFFSQHHGISISKST